jgi:hypothetical protein
MRQHTHNPYHLIKLHGDKVMLQELGFKLYLNREVIESGNKQCEAKLEGVLKVQTSISRY